MTNLMFYAWVNHGIEPSKIYNMSKDEQTLVRAFYILEMERRVKANNG